MRRATLRRAAALWLLLFGIYAATIGLDAYGSTEYPGDEPHFLLTAKSIVEDGNADLVDEFRTRDYEDISDEDLQPHGALTKGQLNEPHGVGFPLLIAPAYALGGPVAVEVFLAAIAALAIVGAYALALRVAPDPWAVGAAILAGLSPPMLAWSTAVQPALAAGAALAGALLLALRLSERLRLSDRQPRASVFGCFVLLGTLPWLSARYVVPMVVLAGFTARILWTGGRRMLAVGGVEIIGFSLAFYGGLNNGLFGGLTPYAAQLPGETITGAHTFSEHIERSYRFVALWIDREYGLLRWAPLFAMAWIGLWFVWREWRAGLARVIPELRTEELAAALCASVIGAQLVVATFFTPTMFGFWFPGRHLMPVLPLMVPLVAIGLRHMPRLGAALGAIGLIASVWLYVDVRWGGAGLVVGRPDAPWGPLEAAWPSFQNQDVVPYVVAAVVAVVVAIVFFVDARVWQRLLRRERAATAM